MSFAPGEEVVCVDDSPGYITPSPSGVVKGKQYIIKDVCNEGHPLVMQFAPWVLVIGVDTYLSHLRFRPVRRETDEEFLRSVQPAPKKVRIKLPEFKWRTA